MKETKYYKDLNHNYLVIKGEAQGDTGDEVKDKASGRDKSYEVDREYGSARGRDNGGYRNRMITGNRMKKLLPCSIRSLNGETWYYYEISSRQNMKRAFADKSLDLRRLFRLFKSICEASAEVGEYLLEDIYLVLDPEYIFLTPGTEEYSFLYYPQEYDWDMTMMSFAEYLVERTDHEDKKALEIVYRIYESIVSRTFILSEALSLFPEPEETERKEKPGFLSPDCGAEQDDIEQDGSEYSGGGEDKEYIFISEYEEDEEDSSAYAGRSADGRTASVVLLTLSVTAAVGIVLIRYIFLLSAEENILSIAGITALIAVSAFLLLHLITVSAGRKKNTDKKEERFSGKGYRKYREETPRKNISQEEEHCWGSPPPVWSSTPAKPVRPEEDISENTVFLETELSKRECKLYGVNRGNRYHIDLEKLPCTVGKMAGGVDFVIKDDSISRIHARLSREGEEILVTDLNSTNGTFKNGLRLEPNETASLEPGDEIRFGRMTFCYR